jgi:hypothetical protein
VITVEAAIYSLCLFVLGCVIGVAFVRLREHKAMEREELQAINPIPAVVAQLTQPQVDLLRVRMEEWQTVIQTQMHFNDLIIKFRSIALTTFVTFAGGAIALENLLSLKWPDVLVILLLPCGFWFSCFLLDYYYYHRLLLGAVAQAGKFDKWDFANADGHFGLTKCISAHIKKPRSNVLVKVFYLIPGLLFILLLLAWQLFLD